MTLLQLCTGQIRLGAPLPWNVRTGTGQLLLGKGYLLKEQPQIEALLARGVYVDKDDFERHQREEQLRAAQADPFTQWSDMLRKAGALLRAPLERPDFQPQLTALGRQLLRIAIDDPDMGAFALAHMERASYPVLHAMQTAFVALLVGRRLGLPLPECEAAVNAGLTMNLSMMDLQARLSEQEHPLNSQQRADVRSHPQRSCELLKRLGVSDALWLEAVLNHHEGEGGYPCGRTDVPVIASVLRHVDIYLAKTSARGHRPALPVDQAARDLFLKHGGSANPVAAAIVKEMGLYPPGSCVKLENGDTAVVLRRGENTATPRVASLCNAGGVPYPLPQARDTCQARFKVKGPVAFSNVRVRIDGVALFRL